MKVLHVINNLNKGGAERLLVDILPLYRDTEADVSVLQLSSKASSLEYLNLLNSRQVKVFSLGNGSLYNPLLILKLRSFIRKNKFDIVHAHLFPTMYWISLAFRLLGRNRPVLIFTEHSTQNNRINNPVLRPVDRFIYKKYDSVIAISEAIAAKLKAWMGNAPPVALIRNGVNTDHFSKASAYDAAFFSREFSIPEPAVKILMTARFLYPKDHLTVVKAIKLLPLHFHVIFAGEGAERAGVEQWVNDNGLNERVHFAGFRSDIPALMKSVDLNVLSSRYEGMSGVTLEALAAGKPFLGSDVPGINDVVPDNRFVFESGNENHLAAQAEHVLNNEKVKQQMVSEGLKFAQLFDVSIMIAQHIALYKQQILDKKRS